MKVTFRDIHLRRLRTMTPPQVLAEAERRGYWVHYPGGDRSDVLFAVIMGDVRDPWRTAANERIVDFLIEAVRPVLLTGGRVVYVQRR